jgi:hypothetical protein
MSVQPEPPEPIPSPDEKAVREILGRLPILEGQRNTIPMEATNILIVAGLMQGSDEPQARIVGTAKARKQIQRVITQASNLRDAILALPADACSAIDFCPDNNQDRPPPTGQHPDHRLRRDLAGVLELFARRAEHADKFLERNPKPAPQGAPSKQQAPAVTQFAGSVYERLTGKVVRHPTFNAATSTATGPFLTFLKELFSVLGIKASARSQLNAFLDQKSTPPKQT